MNNNESTTAIGFYCFAESYQLSAEALETANVRVPRPEAPIYFCYYHSIELYLKSWLLANGVPSEDLYKEYGHDIQKIADKAKVFGLELRKEDEALISYMSQRGVLSSKRYLREGLTLSQPTADDLCRTCSYLRENTGKAAGMLTNTSTSRLN